MKKDIKTKEEHPEYIKLEELRNAVEEYKRLNIESSKLSRLAEFAELDVKAADKKIRQIQLDLLRLLDGEQYA